jgi:NTP pyrophosphatase (non-canonical NTP hydrolase)
MGLHSDLLKKIIAFRDERDWRQFHNPKDLAAGLAIEAAELQEIFLWKSPDELAETIAAKKGELSEELADITWFVLLLAHELNIDLNDAVEDKLQKNAAKYPADKVRGSSKKYDEYDDDQPHTDK